jgi:hypothetical protein
MLSTDSPLEINSLYRLRLWDWDHNPKTNKRIPISEVDDFIVLEKEEPYKGRFVYLLQYYASGAKKKISYADIGSYTKLDPNYNSRTSENVMGCFPQYRDNDKPNWFSFFMTRYGVENVQFRSKNGFCQIDPAIGNRFRIITETIEPKQGIHTEYEDEYYSFLDPTRRNLFPNFSRKGEGSWIQKEGKYCSKYRKDYFPGEEESFKQEILEGKLKVIWYEIGLNSPNVSKFEVREDNLILGLPSRELIDFVRRLNLPVGIYNRR